MGPGGSPGGHAGGAGDGGVALTRAGAVSRRFRGWRRSLAGWSELLLPTRCLGCGETGAAAGPVPVCLRCRTRIQPGSAGGCPRCRHPALSGTDGCPLCTDWPAGLSRARSATPFRDPAAALVRALKYDGWVSVVPALAAPVTRLVRADPVLSRTRFVTWVPTTAKRRRRRGFNPAELLGRRVAEALGRPHGSALARPREGRRQAGLPAPERIHNVRGAFVPDAGSSGAVRETDVLLVDDVLTTGATVSEAARCLLAAGARQVAVATFARAFQPLPGTPPGPS